MCISCHSDVSIQVTTNRIGNRFGLVPTICWTNGHKHTHTKTRTLKPYYDVHVCTDRPPNRKFDWILPLERLADHTHLSIPRRWIFRQFLTIPTIWNDYDHITINHVHFFGSATAQRVRYRQHDYSLYEYNCCLSHRGFCHWFCWSLSLPTGMLPKFAFSECIWYRDCRTTTAVYRVFPGWVFLPCNHGLDIWD